MCIWAINVAILFLILVSNTIKVALESSDVLKTILLSFQRYVFLVSALFLSERWKKND